jgi:hypothetical protein
VCVSCGAEISLRSVTPMLFIVNRMLFIVNRWIHSARVFSRLNSVAPDSLTLGNAPFWCEN